MEITAYQLAQRYIGIREFEEPSKDNPIIMAMLKMCADWPTNDEVPWCSAFVNWIAWHLNLPTTNNLRARSWLEIGIPIPMVEAGPGFDVVILKRGSGNQPGPEVIEAPGHVGFFAHEEPSRVLVLGGNQSDSVSVSGYSPDDVLGVRRLYEA